VGSRGTRKGVVDGSSVLTAEADSGANGRHNRFDEVLEAALEIFHRNGYAGATIQEVAAQVGVLKGSLYHYIDSKEDLLAWIFEESDRQSLEIMDRVGRLEAPAIDRLRAFAEAWALWYMANVERAALYFSEWRHLNGERLEQVIEKRRAYERFVVDLIEASKREGDADPSIDPRLACFLILAGINGVPMWYRRGGADSAAEIAAIHADMVVAVLRGGPGRP